MIPMLPAAPRTSTDSPGAKRAWARPKWATAPELPSVTAPAADRFAGRGNDLLDRGDRLLDVAAAQAGERPHALVGP